MSNISQSSSEVGGGHFTSKPGIKTHIYLKHWGKFKIYKIVGENARRANQTHSPSISNAEEWKLALCVEIMLWHGGMIQPGVGEMLPVGR